MEVYFPRVLNTHTHTHTHTCTHTHTHTHTHTRTHTNAQTRTYTCISTYLYNRIHTYILACMGGYTHTNKYTYKHIYINTYTHKHIQWKRERNKQTDTQMWENRETNTSKTLHHSLILLICTQFGNPVLNEWLIVFSHSYLFVHLHYINAGISLYKGKNRCLSLHPFVMIIPVNYIFIYFELVCGS